MEVGFWIAIILIVAIDLRDHRIPKALNFTALGFLVLDTPRAICLIALIWSFYLLLARVTRCAIGYGDVRLSPITLAGVDAAPLTFNTLAAPHLIAWTLGSIFILLFRARVGAAIPFAPFLALGTLLQ